MRAAVVLFGRDLRVHDHPVLAEAHRRTRWVVPLFVWDEKILAGRFAASNRVRFLTDCLADLRDSLRQRGGDLVVRYGDPVHEAVALASEVGADGIFVSTDVSGYASRRRARLEAACARQRITLVARPAVSVVPADELKPTGGDHYRVFTPYWRAWQAASWRTVAPTPGSLRLPEGVEPGPLSGGVRLATARRGAALPSGGEREGRLLVGRWARTRLAGYEQAHDDLAADGTSRLSPYLHFGCVSALELARWLGDRPGAEPFIRQLCWRDFYQQVTAAFPAIATADYRPRRSGWRDDADGAAAWREGLTGYPIVDAGMRQLVAEGWMHNRARLIVASFLTKQLGVDWRVGADHFLDHLVDGDLANNSGNWQWVAGTGNDTRPNRVFNPLRQAARFDPEGDYVRRHVPELAAVAGGAVHQPWKLTDGRRRQLRYPPPIVEPLPRAGGDRRRGLRRR